MSDANFFEDLLRQAQELQGHLADAQASAADEVVEGQAGGGVVKVAVTGGFEFRSVTIDPVVVDRDDVSMLEDLVLAAVRDAVARAQELTESAIGGAMGNLGDAIGGLGGFGIDIGDMLGAFNSGADLPSDEVAGGRPPAIEAEGRPARGPEEGAERDGDGGATAG
ncbi:MAG TPA: YbaB/EbfC family nucleoid-associated protein [Acidimicrobiales bacterium]|nr:YbaB/EbfC family nucleoid-associated protein [Acidimicrobiales bacterium]